MKMRRVSSGMNRLAVSAASIVLLAWLFPADAEGANRVRVRGQLQLTATGEKEGIPLNLLNRGDTMFDPLMLRLFVEAAPHEDTQVITQFVYNDAMRNGFATYAAFVLHEVFDQGALYLQAGKIPNPFGIYVPHLLDAHRPIAGIPLIWAYHTTYAPGSPPADIDDLLAVRGRGELGFSGYPSSPGSPMRGMPVLYAACYDLGAGLVGAKGDFEYRAAVTNGSPGNPIPYVDDTNDDKGVMGRFGWSPDPMFRIGASGGTGSPHPDRIGARLTDGASPEDFDQWIGGADAALVLSRVTLRSEWVWNRFETPFTGDLDLTGYFVEFEATPLTGLAVGARWDELLFQHVTDSNGDRHRWDEPVKRLEVGAVYRIHADLSVRASSQITSFGAAGFEDDARVDALQLNVAF